MAKKTIEEGFETLIGRLEPLYSEREKSTKHRGTVKSSLEKNFDCIGLFETGSFAMLLS